MTGGVWQKEVIKEAKSLDCFILLVDKNKDCFSVQFHPEASAGPHDSSYLFDEFVQMINK